MYDQELNKRKQMSEIGTIAIAGVSERDIDLLLLEEFIASPDFASWFVAQLGFEEAANALVTDAKRSVTHSTGESDLEILFIDNASRSFKLLIENKVGAGFQPMQAQRYRERGENYKKGYRISDYRTVLVAPTSYFSGDFKGFDARINYEDIFEWFASNTSMGNRKQYKLSLLHSAIEKSTFGYQTVADAVVTEFWHSYWKLAQQIAPEFEMPEPSSKPAGSSFIYFTRANTPKGTVLCHKLVHGFFDIQFAGMGDQLAELREQFGSMLTDDMQIEKAGKSAVIRINVPKLSIADSFEIQLDVVAASIQAGKQLLAWFQQLVTSR